MWEDHKKLRHISESIAGITINGRPAVEPYYIRNNKDVEPEASLEYSLEKPSAKGVPDELYETSAGKIVLCDEGEFGGYLQIGGKQICNGNFSTIFRYNGEKYVVDTLAHMGTYRFRLIRIFDDGSIEVVYNSNEDDYYDTLGRVSCAAMDAFCIDKDMFDNEVVFFLCSGINTANPEHIRKVQYLLMFDSNRKDHQLIRIDLPVDKIEFSHVTSIWSDGMMLSIGCDKQVVMAHLPDMSIEYWTGLDEDCVKQILEKKHALRH